MHWLTRTILSIIIALLLICLLLPIDRMPGWGVWLGVLLMAVCSLYLVLTYRHIVGTWRSFGVLVIALYLTLAWLHWQWSLWESPVFLLQNLNTAISLLAWALCVAVGVSSLLLLIYRDASVVFLAAILGVSLQYGQMEQFSATPVGQQLPWGVLITWMMGMLCLAPPAFLIHFGMAIYKEIKAGQASWD
jgi:hypothetical protein